MTIEEVKTHYNGISNENINKKNERKKCEKNLTKKNPRKRQQKENSVNVFII